MSTTIVRPDWYIPVDPGIAQTGDVSPESGGAFALSIPVGFLGGADFTMKLRLPGAEFLSSHITWWQKTDRAGASYTTAGIIAKGNGWISGAPIRFVSGAHVAGTNTELIILTVGNSPFYQIAYVHSDSQNWIKHRAWIQDDDPGVFLRVERYDSDLSAWRLVAYIKADVFLPGLASQASTWGMFATEAPNAGGVVKLDRIVMDSVAMVYEPDPFTEGFEAADWETRLVAREGFAAFITQAIVAAARPGSAGANSLQLTYPAAGPPTLEEAICYPRIGAFDRDQEAYFRVSNPPTFVAAVALYDRRRDGLFAADGYAVKLYIAVGATDIDADILRDGTVIASYPAVIPYVAANWYRLRLSVTGSGDPTILAEIEDVTAVSGVIGIHNAVDTGSPLAGVMGMPALHAKQWNGTVEIDDWTILDT